MSRQRKRGINRAAGVLMVLLMLTLLISCGAEEDSHPAPEEGGVTFTDDLGRQVTVPAAPQRAAALIGSFADVWCLAGGQETLVAAAEDSWTQFELELDESVTNLGEVKTPNVEALLAANPDFVLGSAKTAADVELMDLLEELGISVAYFDISSFGDYLRMLDICTQLTGCPDNYQLYGARVEAQVEVARGRAQDPGPRVLYIRATGSSCKVKNSQNTVLGEMLAEDPDYIFVVVQGSDPADAQALLEATLLSNPAWEGLTAVREGRYHVMDQRLYNVKPNARWGEAYEKLADILYPEQ